MKRFLVVWVIGILVLSNVALADLIGCQISAQAPNSEGVSQITITAHNPPVDRYALWHVVPTSGCGNGPDWVYAPTPTQYNFGSANVVARLCAKLGQRDAYGQGYSTTYCQINVGFANTGGSSSLRSSLSNCTISATEVNNQGKSNVAIIPNTGSSFASYALWHVAESESCSEASVSQTEGQPLETYTFFTETPLSNTRYRLCADVQAVENEGTASARCEKIVQFRLTSVSVVGQQPGDDEIISTPDDSASSQPGQQAPAQPKNDDKEEKKDSSVLPLVLGLAAAGLLGLLVFKAMNKPKAPAAAPAAEDSAATSTAGSTPEGPAGPSTGQGAGVTPRPLPGVGEAGTQVSSQEAGQLCSEFTSGENNPQGMAKEKIDKGAKTIHNGLQKKAPSGEFVKADLKPTAEELDKIITEYISKQQLSQNLCGIEMKAGAYVVNNQISKLKPDEKQWIFACDDKFCPLDDKDEEKLCPGSSLSGECPGPCAESDLVCLKNEDDPKEQQQASQQAQAGADTPAVPGIPQPQREPLTGQKVADRLKTSQPLTLDEFRNGGYNEFIKSYNPSPTNPEESDMVDLYKKYGNMIRDTSDEHRLAILNQIIALPRENGKLTFGSKIDLIKFLEQEQTWYNQKKASGGIGSVVAIDSLDSITGNAIADITGMPTATAPVDNNPQTNPVQLEFSKNFNEYVDLVWDQNQKKTFFRMKGSDKFTSSVEELLKQRSHHLDDTDIAQLRKIAEAKDYNGYLQGLTDASRGSDVDAVSGDTRVETPTAVWFDDKITKNRPYYKDTWITPKETPQLYTESGWKGGQSFDTFNPDTDTFTKRVGDSDINYNFQKNGDKYDMYADWTDGNGVKHHEKKASDLTAEQAKNMAKDYMQNDPNLKAVERTTPGMPSERIYEQTAQPVMETSPSQQRCGTGCCEVAFGKSLEKTKQKYSSYGKTLAAESMCGTTPVQKDAAGKELAQKGCCETNKESTKKKIVDESAAGFSEENTGGTPLDVKITRPGGWLRFEVQPQGTDGKVLIERSELTKEWKILQSSSSPTAVSYVNVGKIGKDGTVQLNGNQRGLYELQDLKLNPAQLEKMYNDNLNGGEIKDGDSRSFRLGYLSPPKVGGCRDMLATAKTKCQEIVNNMNLELTTRGSLSKSAEAYRQEADAAVKEAIGKCRNTCKKISVECRQGSLDCAKKAQDKTKAWVTNVPKEDYTESVPVQEVKGVVDDKLQWTRAGCYDQKAGMNKEALDKNQYNALGDDCAGRIMKMDYVNLNDVTAERLLETMTPYDYWMINQRELSPAVAAEMIRKGTDDPRTLLRYNALNYPPNYLIYPAEGVQKALASKLGTGAGEHYRKAVQDNENVIGRAATDILAKMGRTPYNVKNPFAREAALGDVQAAPPPVSSAAARTGAGTQSQPVAGTPAAATQPSGQAQKPAGASS